MIKKIVRIIRRLTGQEKTSHVATPVPGTLTQATKAVSRQERKRRDREFDDMMSYEDKQEKND